MRFSSVSGRNTLKMVTGRYRYNRIWKTRHCAEFRRQEQTHGGGGGGGGYENSHNYEDVLPYHR